jgi:CheY-like chemotaxis protein
MALATFELILRMGKGPGTVETARTAEAALLFTAGMNFDAIVSDIRMPVYDGIDFLREIKSTHRQTPVILVTGDDNWIWNTWPFTTARLPCSRNPSNRTRC